MEELNLWQNFLEGDKKALSSIFLAYHDDLYRYGRKIAGSSDIVEDCIQDVFLKLWNNRKNIKIIRIIKPYLLRSLRNQIIDTLEFIGDEQTFQDGNRDFDNIAFSHEDFIIKEEIDEEMRQKVIHALNELKPNQKEVVYLRYFQEIDFESISKIMNMNVPSARNLLSKSIKVLRDLMLSDLFFLMLS